MVRAASLSTIALLTCLTGCGPGGSSGSKGSSNENATSKPDPSAKAKDRPEKDSSSGDRGRQDPDSDESSTKDKDDRDPGNTEPDGEAPKFDLGAQPKRKKEDSSGPDDCDEVKHVPCDKDSNDLLHALGINCPNEVPKIDASFSGKPVSRGLLSKLGKTKTFNPREGHKYLVLGTGHVSEISKEVWPSDTPASPRICNAALGGLSSKARALPAPLKVNRVGDQDCSQNPALVGTGDCSNTMEAQWTAAQPANGKAAHDYAELRLKMKVPAWANSLAYDFAFLTVEYPVFFQRMFNDFFVAWLESKKWTGNISFDKNNNPISLNAGFLDFRDATDGTPNDPDCKKSCEAPELHGSCFQGHAATNWLSTKVGVTPGEEIELVFAIFDLGDGALDSYVLLDNFRWGCEAQERPETDPPR